MSFIKIRSRKDGSSYSQLCWRENGTQPSYSFDDHALAVKYRAILDKFGPDKVREMLGVEQASKVAGLTVKEWFAHYLKHLTSAEQETMKLYRAYVDNDIVPVMGALPLAGVDETTISRWINAMREKGSSGKTIANKHGFMSAALASAVPKHLPRNPCDNSRLPRADEAEMTFLEPDEFYALHDAMTLRWQPMALFLVTSGVRFSEATALDVGDIDPVRLTCRINKAWKGNGTRIARMGLTKTSKSRRTINVAPEAVKLLDLGRSPDELLFNTIRGARSRIRPQLFQNNAWQPALRKLLAVEEDGKPIDNRLHGKRPRPHDLRHTCASWMIAGGIDFKSIQEHLGHESIVTTIDRYGHLDREAGARAVAAISSALIRPTLIAQ